MFRLLHRARQGVGGGFDSVSLNTFAFIIAAPFCLRFCHGRPVGALGANQLGKLDDPIFSATFGSAGPYLTYYYSLRTLTASQAAAFQYIQPVLSTCFGVLLLGETLGRALRPAPR